VVHIKKLGAQPLADQEDTKKGSRWEIEDRKIAQDELYRCSELLWTQAQFFLSLNTALVGLAGLTFAYVKNAEILPSLVSIFGIFVSVVWLLTGNRIGAYFKATEEYIMKKEQAGKCNCGLVVYQNTYFKNKSLPRLQRVSSTKLIRTILPTGMTILWSIIFVLFLSLRLM
jgi:hypothetical protein